MKLILKTAAAVMLIMLTITACSALTIDGKAIDLKDAEECAHLFLGTNSPLEYVSEIDCEYGSYYIFKDKSAEIYVNKYTGAVEMYSEYCSYVPSLEVNIDQSTAESLAKQYLEKVYPEFNKKNMCIFESNFLDHAYAGSEYSFIYREKIGEIFTQNTASVTISADTGKILSYVGIVRETDTETKEIIPEDKAVSIAESVFPDIKVIAASAYLSYELVRPYDASLYWVITVIGEAVNNFMYGGYVVIDAVSGKVTAVSPYL